MVCQKKRGSSVNNCWLILNSYTSPDYLGGSRHHPFAGTNWLVHSCLEGVLEDSLRCQIPRLTMPETFQIEHGVVCRTHQSRLFFISSPSAQHSSARLSSAAVLLFGRFWQQLRTYFYFQQKCLKIEKEWWSRHHHRIHRRQARVFCFHSSPRVWAIYFRSGQVWLFIFDLLASEMKWAVERRAGWVVGMKIGGE